MLFQACLDYLFSELNPKMTLLECMYIRQAIDILQGVWVYMRMQVWKVFFGRRFLYTFQKIYVIRLDFSVFLASCSLDTIQFSPPFVFLNGKSRFASWICCYEGFATKTANSDCLPVSCCIIAEHFMYDTHPIHSSGVGECPCLGWFSFSACRFLVKQHFMEYFA